MVEFGVLASVWRASIFLPTCFILFFIGSAKGLLVGPAALVVLVVGHTAVILGLWPVHVLVTYYNIAKAKQLGPSLKVISMFLLPLPLILFPVAVIIGSVLVGIGYGFLTPLVATFEAVGAGRERKAYHCIVDGTWSTLEGSCTVVRDFTDLCFHSYLDYLTDFRTKLPKDGHPYDIKLREVPGCIFVGLLGAIVEIPVITGVALAKSPIMLLKGWHRLLGDLWGRQGPCLEAVCVPFAGLAIVLWPLVVVVSVICAILTSPFLGLFGAVVVYEENSVRRGLAYIVNVVAQFDEYTNDLLHLAEGSCFPRPKYRSHDNGGAESVVPTTSAEPEVTQPGEMDISVSIQVDALEHEKPEDEQTTIEEQHPDSVGPLTHVRGAPQGGLNVLLGTSRSLKQTFQEVKVVQIWDNLFKNIEKGGKDLVQEGVIKTADLEEWLRASKSQKSRTVSVGLPTYAMLNSLLQAVKFGTEGLLLYDGTEVTVYNRPKDRVTDWFYEPLLVLKAQLSAAKLKESEEKYLQNWVYCTGDHDRMSAWKNGGIEPEDNMRKGELQALGRRLQGISMSLSRLPTFPRRYQKFIKALALFAQAGTTPEAVESQTPPTDAESV